MQRLQQQVDEALVQRRILLQHQKGENKQGDDIDAAAAGDGGHATVAPAPGTSGEKADAAGQATAKEAVAIAGAVDGKTKANQVGNVVTAEKKEGENAAAAATAQEAGGDPSPVKESEQGNHASPSFAPARHSKRKAEHDISEAESTWHAQHT